MTNSLSVYANYGKRRYIWNLPRRQNQFQDAIMASNSNHMINYNLSHVKMYFPVCKVKS